MKRLLHIITRENDGLAATMIRLQREQGAGELVVVDLAQAPPDYPDLLEKIFAADSVQVW